MLFFRSFFPLSVPIFCAEHRHKRISTAIGARGAASKKEKTVCAAKLYALKLKL